jgi:hypothetical protein
MKVVCPICNVQGVLQQRGNSSRIQHYVGFKDGKRTYKYCKLPKGHLVWVSDEVKA